MIITTTPSIEGRRIASYRGIVSGEAILGANVFRDFFASIRDVVGGRSGSYERVLRDGRDTALGKWSRRRSASARMPSSAFTWITVPSARTKA
jgi:uncharacterized protein YbjQ (UPF0145 family)